ncbi:MAG: hypothetical protein CV088_11925 [Nitrospira sp. LK70]|nr:hypothetical protein [Nitrospira sp. LK70]
MNGTLLLVMPESWISRSETRGITHEGDESLLFEMPVGGQKPAIPQGRREFNGATVMTVKWIGQSEPVGRVDKDDPQERA